MRCAVLGSPIAHSLSPSLHRAAYRALGLDWEYDAVEVTEEGLPEFLAGLGPEWRGLSLTMPLKRVVMPLLDEASETATLAGAANTVVLGDRRTGDNTDVPGMRRALRERASAAEFGRAVVLGGGATATSAVLALAGLGCREVTLYAREPARTAETVAAAGRLQSPPRTTVRRLDELSRESAGASRADVVVSTIPAAAQPPYAAELAGVPVVFDVIYDPWPTPLSEAAAAAGRTVVSGLDLLVHQATLQVELMTGCDEAPLEEMRRAGLEALSGRSYQT
ncbi:MAG: shikimate dehydrogenase [Propionibacteriales bacterium]|nr:shikimate dehydrogenase [Propionibacteriales bacterium]